MKLTATEAAKVLLANAIQERDEIAGYIAKVKVELSSLRKNSKDRARYESIISAKQSLLELRNEQVRQREELVPVAEQIAETSQKIASLCEQRRALFPAGFACADVPLLSAMRNGF